MAIFDVALNPLLVPDASGQMLGFVDPPALADVLHLRAYDFLIWPIRLADQSRGQLGGNLFVKRYFDGIQANWDRLQRRAFQVRDLWNVNKIEDEYLKYLKSIVGWTDEPNQKAITDRLTPDQLRKLIGSSIALWRIRGSQAAYEAIIRIVTEARLVFYDWFYYRYIIEETGFGEDHQGRDPYLVPVSDETLSDIRIVDDGTLDRVLIRSMVQFFKPGGEKVSIHWIDFLDLFNLDDDDAQWESVESGSPTVTGGLYALTDDTSIEEVATSVAGSDEWTDYLAYCRVRFTQASGVSSISFFYLNSTDHFKIEFDVTANDMTLSVVVAGAPTVLDVYSFSDHSQTLVENVFYGIRIVCENISSPTETTDGAERIATTTNLVGRQTKGKLTVRHEVGATVEMSEIEMFQLPMESNLIGLNGEIT
jgi:hypothetical protein